MTSGALPAKRATLPPRLTITEVRGYLGQARRAARIVALAPGVEPATETVFVDALRAIGRVCTMSPASVITNSPGIDIGRSRSGRNDAGSVTGEPLSRSSFGVSVVVICVVTGP